MEGSKNCRKRKIDIFASVHSALESKHCLPPQTMVLLLKHLNDRYGGVQAHMRTIGLTDEQSESLRRAVVE